MALIERLGAALHIRAGEGRLVSLVLAYGFSLGLGRLFSGAAVSGLFLDLFGARAMPYSFLGTAVVVPITGLAYLRMQGRVPLSRLIGLTIVLLVAALLGFRVVLGLSQTPALVMTLMIGYTTVYVLVSLMFWGLVNQLFNVRQGKRLFGLLSAGSEVADISGGLLTLALAPVIGSPNLLLLGCAGLLGALFAQRAIVQRYPLGADKAAASDEDKVARGVRAVLAGGYVRLFLALVALSQLGYFFVENIFYDLSMAHFSGPNQFSALVGATVAASSILTILLQVTLVGPLVNRFGLSVGLPVLPALLLIGAGTVALSGTLFGAVFVVFVLMLITRVSERALRFSVDETVVQIAYQPLPATQRSLLQTLVDGGVKPLAAGVAGGLILLCTRLLGFGGVQLAALLAVITVVWLVVAVLLGRSYPAALLGALTRRRLSGANLRMDDHDSLAIITRGLRSPYAGEALYALQLLEELEHPSLPAALATLLAHPEAGVRQEALRRIERSVPNTLHGTVLELLARETEPQVRGQALRTLAAGGALPAPLLASALEAAEPAVQLGAIAALARSDENARLQTWLQARAGSAEPAERALAAQAVGELGGLMGVELLQALVNDQAIPVRRAALAAVAGAGANTLWPQVVAALANPALRPAALASIVAGGANALRALDDVLARAEAPISLRLQAARAAGKLGPKAGPLLVALLDAPSEELRHGFALALEQSGYRATGPTVAQLWEHIRAEAMAAANTLATRRDLGETAAYAPLRAALDGSVKRSRERVLALLSALVEPEMLRRARVGLAHSSEQQAYAVEALDLLLPQEFRAIVLPLVEAGEASETLAALERRFPQQRCSAEQRLAELMADTVRQHAWVRVCAHAAVQPAGETPELVLFERVQLLKGSTIFRTMAEEELLAVASLLQPVQFGAGATVFARGDAGSCSYFVARGRVHVHDGQRVLGELGPRDMFGELAVLDARPRSLSATTLEPTQLLRLDREPLFELIADHVAVAHGIISVLIRTLRANMRELDTLNAEPT